MTSKEERKAAQANRQAQERFTRKMRKEGAIRLSGFVKDEDLKEAFEKFRAENGLSTQKALIQVMRRHLLGDFSD
jgi:Holliday junction resolvasome RuvABC DNA-binding subunit